MESVTCAHAEYTEHKEYNPILSLLHNLGKFRSGYEAHGGFKKMHFFLKQEEFQQIKELILDGITKK